MRKFKLLAVLAATVFAATNLWALSFPIGDGTGLEYTWTYPSSGKTILVITYDGEGSGVMPNYDNSLNKAPWYGVKDQYVGIELPDGLKNIGNYAFYDYPNEELTELTIPASVTSIGIQAVRITHLERIVMQSAVAPSLGANAISAHAVDFTIIYPCGSGESYVNNWTAFYSNLTPAEPCSEPKPAFNPSGDCGTNAHYAFNGSTGVLTISGTGAMQDFTAGTQPWYSYMNLVTSIVVEEGITTIGNLAFSDCSASVSIPSTLTSIGTSAFSSNNVLSSITIPASVVTIGNRAFNNCSALETVTFVSPNSALTSIGMYAFQNTALTSVTIPATTDGLTISSYAFRNLSTLTSLSFAAPSNVTTIDSYAFAGTGLTSVEIPATKSEMTINGNAFNCTSLATVTFATPSKVTTISNNAFYQATISSITLPASLTSLGGRAFRDCANLAEVIFTSADCPNLLGNTFQGCNASLRLKCPDESGLLYSNKIFPVSEDYWNILYMYPSGERAPSPAAGGFCGKDGSEDMTWNIVWNDDAKCIMLDIDGEGPMEEWDFMAESWAPWKNFRSWIKYIKIAEGVTTIGGSAFVGCDQVKTFIIPSTVTSIGADAFFGCDNDDVEVYSYANPATMISWDDRNCDDFLTHGKGPRARTYTWDERTAHLQETKCYVPSAYLAGYRTRWNAGSTDWTGSDVNVFFAVGLNDANDADGINEILTNTNGQRVPVLTLTRPLNRDGYFATICLPIDMDAAAIAKSALKDAQIREFTNAVMNAGMLEVEFSPVDHIEAGKPYFVKYTDEAMGDALDRLDFVDAVVNNVAPIEVTHGNLKMVGTYVPKSVSVQTSATDGDGVLFLGANNTLYWPSKAGTIKPFRAYFKLVGGGGAGSPKRGTPARIVERKNAPTALDNATNNAQYTKRVENGQLVIERNGVRYNAAGQVVK